MSLSSLNAISPIDGRYRGKVASLAAYYSEEALIKYRVKVEIEYFIALCEIPLPQLANFDSAVFPALRAIYEQFSTEDALKIKEIESVTNHDVKAVEYFIKEKFDKLNLASFKEFIHFGLTSQDINNTAIPLSIKDSLGRSLLPYFGRIDCEIGGFIRRMGRHSHVGTYPRTTCFSFSFRERVVCICRTRQPTSIANATHTTCCKGLEVLPEITTHTK